MTSNVSVAHSASRSVAKADTEEEDEGEDEVLHHLSPVDSISGEVNITLIGLNINP
jgi:hypothetical protein